MTATSDEEEARLRRLAETRLAAGTAPPAAGWTASADALAMLYRLSSSPDTAGEALKFLHELQVHQVELGLQQEQIKAGEHETADALAHYQALFELAPVAYFVVDPVGVIIDANRAGLGLLGVFRGNPVGRALETFLTPESRLAARGLFTMARSDGASGSCCARFATADISVRLVASASPSGDCVMIVVYEEPGPGES